MKSHSHAHRQIGQRPPRLTPQVLTKNDLKEWFYQLEVFMDMPIAEQFMTLNLKTYISASTDYELI